MWAGSKRVGGVGWRTVPYEMAIERIFDNDEDRAAPIVPDDNAKAADVFRPRLGPDITRSIWPWA